MRNVEILKFFFQAFYGDIHDGNIVQKALSILSSLAGAKYILFPDTLAEQVIINLESYF
jgi:hypothetical protein